MHTLYLVQHQVVSNSSAYILASSSLSKYNNEFDFLANHPMFSVCLLCFLIENNLANLRTRSAISPSEPYLVGLRPGSYNQYFAVASVSQTTNNK
jgi:hypothetical protein